MYAISTLEVNNTLHHITDLTMMLASGIPQYQNILHSIKTFSAVHLLSEIKEYIYIGSTLPVRVKGKIEQNIRKQTTIFA